MKVLIPVSVNKRLPEIPKGEYFSAAVVVRVINKKVSETFNTLAFAYRDSDGRWEDAMPKEIGKSIEFMPRGDNEITEWYDEVDIESLFPDEEFSYHVASGASGNRINGTMLHQEGQEFLKNFIIRQIKK